MVEMDIAQGIYIITTEDGFPCKVGLTNDLNSRVKQLQVGNWVKLRAVWFSFALGPSWKGRTLNLWAAFNTAGGHLVFAA